MARASSSSVAASETVTTKAAALKSGATRRRSATLTTTLSPARACSEGFVNASLMTFTRGAAHAAGAAHSSARHAHKNLTGGLALKIFTAGFLQLNLFEAENGGPAR